MKKIIVVLFLMIFIFNSLLFSDGRDIFSKQGFACFFEYPVVFMNGEELPYPYGFGMGVNLDFGGKMPILNLAGVEFSGRYSFLDIDENYHYFSSGMGLYIRSAFRIPVNVGLRVGAGSGWVINSKKDPETGNNQRMNGLYTVVSPFVEIKTKDKFYFQAGYEARKQDVDNTKSEDSEYDDKDDSQGMDIIFVRIGFRY